MIEYWVESIFWYKFILNFYIFWYNNNGEDMKFIKRNLDRIILGIILLSLIGILIFYLFDTLKKQEEVPEAKKVDEIVEYGYNLKEDDSQLYHSLFADLKVVLSEENINYDEYAKKLASLFVIDFYTLNNKTTNMDIGGIQYLYSGIKDNFILKATDTIYKNVKSNIYGDRNQKLPIVSNVVIKSSKNITFEYGDLKDNSAYEVVVNIEYEKDMGYPKEVVLTIVHENNKLVVIEVK